MPYFVYIIQSQKDDRYYVGSTNDLVERLQRHNQGRSKYTKDNGPWELVYTEEYPDRSTAIRRENSIKKRKKRAYIQYLVIEHKLSVMENYSSQRVICTLHLCIQLDEL